MAVPLDDRAEPGAGELVVKSPGLLLEDWATGLELPELPVIDEGWDEGATEKRADEDRTAEEETGMEELAIALLVKAARAVAVLARPVPEVEPPPRGTMFPTPPL